MSVSSLKKKKSSTNSTPSLPDDVMLSCLARVSRLYYPTLALVSKSFRSLLTSPELYKARSLLNHTESVLYVCFLEYRPFKNPRWFTLCRKPNQTLPCDKSNKKKSSGFVLAEVPVPYPPHVQRSSLVAVDSNIYNINGGPPSPSSSFSILDCTSYTWREAPSLPMDLFTASACVLDRKIYVVGSCKDGDSRSLKNTFAVFDTETQVWDHVPNPYRGIRDNLRILCFDEKWHVGTNREVVSYDPTKGKWNRVESEMCSYKYSNCYCEIENVLYSGFKTWHGIEFKWYDTEVTQWRKLEGVVETLPIILANVRLIDYGGKMALLWEENITYNSEFRPNGRKKMLWCAVIRLERRKNREIWGNVEWFDHVLTVPLTCGYDKVIVATI